MTKRTTILTGVSLAIALSCLGDLVVLDTCKVTSPYVGGTNIQTSADMVHWQNYDLNVYSVPTIVSGTNTGVMFFRGEIFSLDTETITNKVQGLNIIGTAALRQMATNQPPQPP